MLITKIKPLIINDYVYLEAEIFLVQTEYPSGKVTETSYDLTGKTIRIVVKNLKGDTLIDKDCNFEGNTIITDFILNNTGDMKGEIQIIDNGKIYTPIRFYFSCLQEVVT